MTNFCTQWLLDICTPQSLIIDIGSYNGAEVIMFRQHFPQATVWGFEASPRNYARSRSHLGEDNARMRLFHAAVSDTDGEGMFYDSVGEADGSGSILPPTAKRLEHYSMVFGGGVPVKFVRIDTLCKENNIEKIDFIHMDAQGAEYKILQGMGDYRPTAIFLEVGEEEMYHGARSDIELTAYLETLGYKLERRCEFDNFYVLK